ncbi:MAG: hypothetical protein KDJ39_06000 [Gammaproteobacteria bacterium]|nr:hypothetical protein [Gammaproteobacteria bacterium]
MSRYASEEQPQVVGDVQPSAEHVRQAVHDVLQAYLSNTQQAQFPPPMPATIGKCVQWWIEEMQEPESKFEHPHTISVAGKDATRWEYPYQLRVIVNLRKFLRIPRRGKEFIVRGREDGVYWRGEDGRMFLSVVEETFKMRQMGTQEYVSAIAPNLGRLRREQQRKAQERGTGEAA